jgi:transforming growth factor-beta-induced protein
MTRRNVLQTLTLSAIMLSSAAMPSLALAQPASARVVADESKNIVQVASSVDAFSTLVAAVKAAGLVETLSGPGPFTVFAPTNDAFAKLPKDLLESLLKPENKATLTKILTYHVVAGSVKAADVVKLTSAKTVEGEDVTIKVDGSTVMVNNAKVTQTDVMASNGVIHVIDTVLVPPSVVAEMNKPPAPALKDIVDTAVAAGNFKTLVAAVQAAGLVDTLKGKGPFTVFAPTDDAFAKLPAGTVDTLLKPENKQMLIDILTYHVVAGEYMAERVVKLTSLRTVNGERITIKVQDGKVFINNAQVIIADVKASNGVIHVIDTVLLPPAKPTNIIDTATAAGNFKTLLAAIDAAGLTETLKRGNYTVFAPTDEAFAKLPAGTVETLLKPENKSQLVKILTYHVLRGRYNSTLLSRHMDVRTLEGTRAMLKKTETGLMINNANVISADIVATNGIIHAIDAVLIPPGNIIDVATAAGSFKTLTAAIKAAGLEDALKRGNFTVFAPTDEAFAKLPAGTVETLLKPENKAQLRSILLYHVVGWRYYSPEVVKFHWLRTLQGGRLNVEVKDGKVMINNATVVTPDVLASNGVIHVIDTVLLPPSK